MPDLHDRGGGPRGGLKPPYHRSRRPECPPSSATGCGCVALEGPHGRSVDARQMPGARFVITAARNNASESAGRWYATHRSC